MSRLQNAVNAFVADWLARTGGQKPGLDTIANGTFSRLSGQPFCLCYKPMAAVVDFTGLKCVDCLKPVTSETNEWYDEARAERRAYPKR